MKKILFIVNNGVISPNENGGASVYYSHLELLFLLGYEISVLAVQWGEDDIFDVDHYKEIHSIVKDIIPYEAVALSPKLGIKRLFNAIFNPDVFEYFFLNSKNKQFLESTIKENSIDLVWAEWRWAGLWAGFSKLTVPVIYSHHDWEYKLAKLRNKRNLLKRFHTYQKKRAEYKLVSFAEGCISGSNTEKLEIEKISNKKALYIPTTYTSVDLKLSPNNSPNIIHLGGMGTTANRIGLERFIDVCWEGIKKENNSIKLIIIGSIEQAENSLKEKLFDPRIECKGFVKNLDSVMFPNDIHIIPWEYNTGTRTRLPVIFNYQQVLIAIGASVAALPEVINDKNSVLCDSLEEMQARIILIANDKDKREELAREGKRTFFNNFVAESQVKRLKKFLEKL